MGVCAEQLKIAVAVRQIEVDHRKTQDDDHEIENVEARGASAAPVAGARELEVHGVEQEHEQRDGVFGVVIAIGPGETVDPDETQNSADGDGDQADEDARLAHALKEVQGGKTPNDVAKMTIAQEAILQQKDGAENKRESECGVGENAQGNVEREDHAMSLGRRKAVGTGTGEMSGEEENQDERQDEGAYGALAMVELEAEIGER